MDRDFITARKKQRGAILVVALMFLIAITLLTLSSMRATNIGLYMAQNEESRIAAEQAAQALADAIAQLRRRRAGEGQHQQLFDRQALLHDQPRHQAGELPGLACACAGLQEAQPGFKGKAVGFEGGVVQPFTS